MSDWYKNREECCSCKGTSLDGNGENCFDCGGSGYTLIKKINKLTKLSNQSVTHEQKAWLADIKSRCGTPINVTIRQLIQKAMEESKGNAK